VYLFWGGKNCFNAEDITDLLPTLRPQLSMIPIPLAAITKRKYYVVTVNGVVQEMSQIWESDAVKRGEENKL